jgi:hypothetical protein
MDVLEMSLHMLALDKKRGDDRRSVVSRREKSAEVGTQTDSPAL